MRADPFCIRITVKHGAGTMKMKECQDATVQRTFSAPLRFIFYSPYELIPLHKSRGARQGALIKIVFADELVGYADCHPWPELGDTPLSEQLHLLSQGSFTTPHLKKSLFFARWDAEARSANRNLFEALSIPTNHCSLLDLSLFNRGKIVKEGYKRVKFKITMPEIPSIKQVFSQLRGTDCKARLDFNSKLTYQEFEKFLSQMEKFLELIDFCEDPFPFNVEQWTSIRQKFGVSLACDRQSEQAVNFPEAADVLVFKPAIQEEHLFLHHPLRQKIVITSYLDHPLGQLSAAWSAARLFQRIPQAIDICGLLTHPVYEPNAFSHVLTGDSPILHSPTGKGLGFDDLLENLPWKMFHD